MESSPGKINMNCILYFEVSNPNSLSQLQTYPTFARAHSEAKYTSLAYTHARYGDLPGGICGSLSS
jgi:hypothetical protein